MAINNYEDFLKVYEKPSLDGVIVGFSGIDPQKKSSGSGVSGGDGCECDNTTLTDEQQSIVDGKIYEKFNELEIRIDSGNIDPDAEEDDILPGYLDQKEIDHEVLKNLYGGGSEGHYHLSKAERDKIISYPSYSELSLNISQNIQHERLLGLLGGDDNGHFHLTQAERSKLQGYPEFGNLGNSISVNHEGISGLLGGDDNGHFHLTQAERSKLQNYPEFSNLENSINVNHERINGLLGGNSDGHYHMTENERANLLKIITALFPNGAIEPVLPSDIENKLSRETWTFVLEDDTTYQRDVAIWN